MKQINEFIVKKVILTQTNEIDLFAEIDSVPQTFNVKFEVIDGAYLFNFPPELEFLLRANEVLLSKSLIGFLSQTQEIQSNIPAILYSRKLRKRTAASNSNRLKAA
jgi:hypothetical protein